MVCVVNVIAEGDVGHVKNSWQHPLHLYQQAVVKFIDSSSGDTDDSVLDKNV